MIKYDKETVNSNYENAKKVYASLGTDTDKVLEQLGKISISLHCWQGDDVTGFETGADGISGGGILATGNYPGRARTGDELRQDLDKALSLIPGKHRVNLHALYAETDGVFVERDQLKPAHFEKWINWAKSRGLALDFNPSFFSHKLAASGFTLSSRDEKVRRFWIEHGKRSREIAAAIGQALGTPSVNNVWIPDGSKDITVNKALHRQILKESLDELFSTSYDDNHMLDAVESKLFGIGSESYVVGSHEFYMGYAMKNNKMLCLDAGHFHPTETISDKISSILTFSDNVLLHVSRGVRWDSDHVVILNDDLLALTHEIRRADAYGKVFIALDFFDASINRLTAWVTGTRATLKAVLSSLLEPWQMLAEAEEQGRLGDRLALLEEFKALPMSAVWDKFCQDNNVPVGLSWLESIKDYENQVLKGRK